MPDAATIGVLRDVATITLLALAFGVFFYHGVRSAYPLASWNYGGNVLTRLYDRPDAMLAMLLLSWYLLGLYLPTEPTTTATAAKSDPIELGSILIQIVMALTQACVLVAFLRFARGFDPVELFGLRNLPVSKAVSYALAAIAPIMVVVVVVNLGSTELLNGVWPDASPQDIVKAFETTGSVAARILMSFAAIIVAPLTEELLFRGLIYGVVKRFTDSWFAAIVSSLLFATVHLHVGSFIPLWALAMLLVAAYELTGCLLVPMLIHALFNGVMVGSMVLGGAS
jgi:membrane protease YdiL (CAAX protease family)